jgi:uncharacterized protein (DUF433 family)
MSQRQARKGASNRSEGSWHLSPARYCKTTGNCKIDYRETEEDWRRYLSLERTVGASHQDIITMEPGKRGGKPCIRGMRITVYDVLSYLAAGMTHEEVLADFPFLTEEDIRACLGYAAFAANPAVAILTIF